MAAFASGGELRMMRIGMAALAGAVSEPEMPGGTGLHTVALNTSDRFVRSGETEARLFVSRQSECRWLEPVNGVTLFA